MKKTLTETKLKSALGVGRHLITTVVCLGAVILICSSARAQNLFEADGNIYEFTSNGVRTTFASGFTGPSSLAFDRTGNLFVADVSGTIYKFTPAGVRTSFALGLNNPLGLACDSAGNLFVADDGDGTIYKFTPQGARSTFASGLSTCSGLAFDRVGNLFVSADFDAVTQGVAKVYKFTPEGVRSIFASGFTGPWSLAFDNAGNLWVADTGDIDGLGTAIYKVTPSGVRTTFLSWPRDQIDSDGGLAFDSAGNLFVTDGLSGSILKFTPSGVRSTFASGGGVSLAFQPTTPPPGTGPPVVTTNPATFIASFSAALDGSVNPHGLATTFHFQYGTTTNYGLTTPPQTHTGNTLRNVRANISSLTASTTYHFRIVASNSDGTRLGGDRTLTTLTATGPPVVTTKPATNVAASSATLDGALDPHGLTTTVHFQYGTTISYGHTTPMQSQTGNTYRNIASNIGGLTAQTTYHFRIVATNSAGARVGSDRTFTTP